MRGFMSWGRKRWGMSGRQLHATSVRKQVVLSWKWSQIPFWSAGLSLGLGSEINFLCQYRICSLTGSNSATMGTALKRQGKCVGIQPWDKPLWHAIKARYQCPLHPGLRHNKAMTVRSVRDSYRYSGNSGGKEGHKPEGWGGHKRLQVIEVVL